MHLAAGCHFFQNFELFTKEMLIHLAAGGQIFQKSRLPRAGPWPMSHALCSWTQEAGNVCF